MAKLNVKALRALGVKAYDAAEHLQTKAQMVAFLDAAMADGDPRVVAQAIGAVSRAHGMTKLAKKTGKSREALYRALSATGNPELATVAKVLGAQGLRLSVVVA
jgi:probable addiction module antidote protein